MILYLFVFLIYRHQSNYFIIYCKSSLSRWTQFGLIKLKLHWICLLTDSCSFSLSFPRWSALLSLHSTATTSSLTLPPVSINVGAAQLSLRLVRLSDNSAGNGSSPFCDQSGCVFDLNSSFQGTFPTGISLDWTLSFWAVLDGPTQTLITILVRFSQFRIPLQVLLLSSSRKYPIPFNSSRRLLLTQWASPHHNGVTESGRSFTAHPSSLKLFMELLWKTLSIINLLSS